MLTREENELLTRIGPGTPGGEMLRRYWQPVALTQELTDERPKKRVTIMGEDLVLFRTRNAEPGMRNGDAADSASDPAFRTPHSEFEYGLVAEQCSHRGASLYYGF